MVAPGNKSRFPGAAIFSKCCERQKRRARNSASDGQKYHAFWSSKNRGLTIGCGITLRLSLATFQAEKQPREIAFIAILGVFRLETAVDSRVTKMAITRFRSSKTRYGILTIGCGISCFVFISRKTPKMAINRDFPGLDVHFQQMLRETKTKSKKFRIRWSKVPRVLEPLNRVMAILVTRL